MFSTPGLFSNSALLCTGYYRNALFEQLQRQKKITMRLKITLRKRQNLLFRAYNFNNTVNKKSTAKFAMLLSFVGGPDETRTRDPLRDRQVF